MKTILALTAAALSFGVIADTHESGTSAQSGQGRWGDFVNIQSQEAQVTEGNRHMIEFNTQSIPSFLFAVERTKTSGSTGDNDTDWTLGLNYAYSIHPNIQLGGRFNYFNGVFANNDVERYDLSAVGWFNLNSNDLANSGFASLSLGTGIAQTFSSPGSRDDLWLASVSIGKRFSLERWGVKNISWTPEVALINENSTSNDTLDYRQATEFRLVQFSVIW